MLPIHLQAVHGYGQPAIGGQPRPPGQTIIQRPYGEQQPVWPTLRAEPWPAATRPLRTRRFPARYTDGTVAGFIERQTYGTG